MKKTIEISYKEMEAKITITDRRNKAGVKVGELGIVRIYDPKLDCSIIQEPLKIKRTLADELNCQNYSMKSELLKFAIKFMYENSSANLKYFVVEN